MFPSKVYQIRASKVILNTRFDLIPPNTSWFDLTPQAPSYFTTSLCHHYDISAYVNLDIFHVSFHLKGHFSRCYRLSCPARYLEGTDHKIDRAKINDYKSASCPTQLGGEMLPLSSSILGKHLKTILYLWPAPSRSHQNSNNNDSLLLLFDGLLKVKGNYMV